MKKDLKEIAQWWIDLGVDGFRVDASNHLEKNWEFPEAHPGYEHFSSLPKHHEYLDELGKEIFGPNDVMAMGEAGGASKEEAIKYCGYENDEFDMLIHFSHVWADCDDDNHLTPGKWAKGTLDLSHVKSSFNRWHQMLHGLGWNLIYWHNHDHPRVISHYGNDQEYHNKSGKMLAYTLYLMPGTPICYQGEEIGMTNVDYEKLSDFRDVEVYTEYDNFMSFGTSHEVAMQALRDRSRDNARSPYQWTDSEFAGFSDVTPWMNVVGNKNDINLESQLRDKDSINATYKDVFHLRKEFNVADGVMTFLDIENPDSYIYINELDTVGLLIVGNFKDKEIAVELDIELDGFCFFRSNYKNRAVESKMVLRPYETIVYKKVK